MTTILVTDYSIFQSIVPVSTRCYSWTDSTFHVIGWVDHFEIQLDSDVEPATLRDDYPATVTVAGVIR